MPPPSASEETQTRPEPEFAPSVILTYDAAVQKGYRILENIEQSVRNPLNNRRAIITRAELIQEGWIIREASNNHWSISSEAGFLVDYLEEDLDYYQNYGRLIHVYSPDHCSVTFSNIFCPNGTVIAINNIKGGMWTSGSPFWSDIIWAMGRHLDYPVTKVWRCHIQNDDTQAMIDQVLAGPGSEGLFRFPREEAAALLGTPNGMGVGWLLADHMDVFPSRRLKDVLAILGSDDNHYYLRFRFVDRLPAGIGHARPHDLFRDGGLQLGEDEIHGSSVGEEAALVSTWE